MCVDEYSKMLEMLRTQINKCAEKNNVSIMFNKLPMCVATMSTIVQLQPNIYIYIYILICMLLYNS